MDLLFAISLFIDRVSHADLTTVVLDVAARTAFPATRPEAQRRMQSRMVEEERKYREAVVPFVRMNSP